RLGETHDARDVLAALAARERTNGRVERGDRGHLAGLLSRVVIIGGGAFLDVRGGRLGALWVRTDEPADVLPHPCLVLEDVLRARNVTGDLRGTVVREGGDRGTRRIAVRQARVRVDYRLGDGDHAARGEARTVRVRALGRELGLGGILTSLLVERRLQLE